MAQFLTVLCCALMLRCLVLAARSTKPVIVKEPSDSIEKIRNPATLVCEATADPMPKITWHHAEDGRRVVTSQDQPEFSSVSSSESGTLFFFSLQLKNQGLYYCNASNINGWASSRNASLQIAFIDSTFEYQPQDKLTTVDSTVELMCRAPQGLPTPKIVWKKDGRVLAPSDRIKVTSEGDLRIDHVARSDSGRYTCEAFNLAGRYESEQAAILSVKVKPMFIVRPSDDTKVVTEDSTFQCAATGDPTPSITWKREEGQIVSSRARILQNGALQISNLQLTDSGKYICVAKSSAGSVEAVAKLDVQEKPNFVLTPSDQDANEGDTVTFHCKLFGSPPPTMFWSNPEKKFVFPGTLDDTKRRKVSKDGMSFVIRDVIKSDEGTYECHGTNHLGMIHTTVTLKVRQTKNLIPPLIEYGPQNLTLREGAQAVLRCFVRNDNSDFGLTWYRGTQNRKLTKNARFRQAEDGTLYINDVRRDDQDIYTCLAKSGERSTRWTATLRVLDEADTMREVKPIDIAVLPQPPEAVEVVQKGSTWMMLRWNPSRVPSAHSPASNYRIEYLSHETGQGWQVAADRVPAAGDGQGITYVIKDLKPETSYQFVIRAINNEGLSKPSKLTPVLRTMASDNTPQLTERALTQQVQTVDIRNVQLKVISSRSVRVDWITDYRQRASPPLTGYLVRYKKRMLNQCISRLKASSTSAEQQEGEPDVDANRLIDSQTNERFYYCSLMPKYAKYLERHLQLVKTNINTESNGDERTIKINLNGISSRKQIHHAVLNHLQPFECFMVTIEPYYFHGMYDEIFGRPSSSKFVLTYDDTPSGPPTDIKAKWISNSSAVVSWLPPTIVHRNGVLLSYVIHILSNESRLHDRVVVDHSKNNATISGLSPTSNYTIHLACNNCKGEGVRSEAFLLHQLVMLIEKDEKQHEWIKQPWFITTMVSIVVLWFFLCGVVISVCCKSMSCKRNAMYKTYANGSLTKTEQCNMHPLLKSDQPLDSSSCGSRQTHQSATSTVAVSGNAVGGPDLTQQFMFEKRGFDFSSAANLSPTLLRYKGTQSYQTSNPVAPYATTSLIQNMINTPGGLCGATQSYSESSCMTNGLMNGSANSGIMSGHQPQHPCGTYSDSTRTGTCSECGSHTGDDETNFGRRGAWGQNSPRGKPLNIGELIPPPPIEPPPMLASVHSINGVVALPPTCPYCSASAASAGGVGGVCRCNSSQKQVAAVAMITTQQGVLFATPPQPRTSPPRLQQTQTAMSNSAASNLRQSSASPKPTSQLHQLQHTHMMSGIAMSDIPCHHSSQHGKSGSSYSSGSNLPSCSETEAPSQSHHRHQHHQHQQQQQQHSRCVADSAVPSRDSVEDVVVGLEDVSNLRSRSPANSSLQGEDDGSVTSSVIASWTSVHTGTSLAGGYRCAVMDNCIADDDEELDSSEITSLNSESDCSDTDDGDKSFLAEAEFATALAQAVEANGLASSSCERAGMSHGQLPIYNSSIMTGLHPQQMANWQPRKKRRHHHRIVARPVSPYSTDSNYSVLPPAPPRPYPKSERRRQMKTHGLHNESSPSVNQQAFESALRQQKSVSIASAHPYYDVVPPDKHIV